MDHNMIMILDISIILVYNVVHKESSRPALQADKGGGSRATERVENMFKKILAVVVIALGVVNLVLGVAFIAIGAGKQAYLHDAMEEEQITLELTDEQIAAGEYVDTAAEAQAAGDLVREHRHEMGTYSEVLGGGRFDPTNPEQLTYAQALNLENYLYLAVASFGLVTVAIVAGVSMLLVGIAFIIIGAWTLFKRRKTEPAAAEPTAA